MNKLSMRDMIGYGPAALGDAVVYSLVSTFLLFFLTTVADIRPAAAGAIVAIGSISAAFFNGIMGYISDNVRTRWGRRVPFMVVFGITIFFAATLLFTAIGAPMLIKIVYYVFMVILFYMSYTGFFVPWFAMGAEFTQDYQERTKLRSYSAVFEMTGSLLAMVVPSSMVGTLQAHGFSPSMAWMITAASLGLLSSACVLVTVLTARKYDKPQTTRIIEAPSISVKNMLLQYWDVLKLGPIKPLLFSSLFFLIAYSILISDIIYFLTFNLTKSADEISALLFLRCAAGIVIIPLINWLCRITDKRMCLMMVQFLCAIIISIFGLTGIADGTVLYIYVIFMGVSTVVYWQVMPAIIYDVCEYDQLETGQLRQGTIVSVQGLVEFISTGVGTQILGIILQLAGFNGQSPAQSETAQIWIQHCVTFVPAFFLILSCIALWKYPITRSVYQGIIRKLEEKQNKSGS